MPLKSILSHFPIGSRDRFDDCIFLSIILFISVVLYVGYIGFYTDDWAFLSSFITSDQQSVVELFQAQYTDITRQRPVQILYWVLLYKLFGLYPLGHHLVNGLVLILGILLFYLILRELTQNRLFSLTIPLVYALLPHYSTNRFWYAAFPIVLSMTLYFLSLYSDLKVLNSRPKYFWGWKLLSVISLLGSTLCYEVFLPLFLLNSFVILYRKKKLDSSGSTIKFGKDKLAVILSSNLLALFLVIVFKALITTRLGNFVLSKEYVKNLTINAVRVNYGDYVFGLPSILWKILHQYANPLVVAVGGVFGLIILAYLYRVANQSKIELPKWDTMLKLTGLGLAIFGMGYAIFLSNGNVAFTPTGLGNRTAIAAAVGVAFSLVGGLGWLSNFCGSNYARKRLFCLLISMLCVSGFLINNTIALFWIGAYSQQLEVLSAIQKHFPTLPAKSTVILDGVCSYWGPGIIFETNWDMSGGLKVLYRDRTLRGDIVKPELTVKKDGIFIPSKSFGDYHYPYKQLLIYNFRQNMSYQLTDEKTARSYFAKFNPSSNNGCPYGYPDKGTPLF